jgi:hypothetical protein
LTPISSLPDGAQTQPRLRLRWRTWARRAAAILWGLLLTWLILEVLLRVGFDALPSDAQIALENVRRVPWRTDRIVPAPPWTADTDYQTILTPGLDDYRVGRGESLFHVDSISLWGARVGLRTNPPQWPVDIAVLGDSFTLCWTEFDDCWVERLHRDYGWSVMNLGLAGTGARSHLLVLKNFAIPLEPDVVIWQWYGNDPNDDYGFGLLRGEYPALDTPPSLAVKPDFGELADYSAVYALLRDQLWTAQNGTPPEWGVFVDVFGTPMRVGEAYNLHGFNLERPGNTLGWEQGVAALTEAARIVREEMNAELLIVLIPTKEEVYAAYVEDTLGAEFLDNLREGRARMIALCAEQGWHCIDMLAPLQAEVSAGRHVYFAADLHLNPYGNRVLAATLAAALRDEE